MLPVLIKLGPLTLHTYGLMVALGFLAAYTLARRRLETAGLTVAFIDNLALLAMFSGLLGARILFFIVDPGAHFFEDPLSFFRIWEGGLVYYGGFLGALIAMATASRVKEISFLLMTDGFSVPLLLGQALGRVGCFAAGCCYGRPSDGWCAVTYMRPDSLAPLGLRLHPSQIYESVGALILFGLLLAREKNPRSHGDSTALYLMGYGLLRFVLEFFRGDERGFIVSSLSPSQWISLAALAAGAGLWTYVRRRD